MDTKTSVALAAIAALLFWIFLFWVDWAHAAERNIHITQRTMPCMEWKDAEAGMKEDGYVPFLAGKAAEPYGKIILWINPAREMIATETLDANGKTIVCMPTIGTEMRQAQPDEIVPGKGV